MKTERFASASIRTAAGWLAGLVLAISLPACHPKEPEEPKADTSAVAGKLALQVGKVQKQLDTSRGELRAVPVPTGPNQQRMMPVYRRREVAGLISGTEKDLDQAIEQLRESELEALRAWSAEEFRRIQEELAASTDHASASPPGSNLRPIAPQQETITAEKTKQLLDQVEKVVGRILFLAAHDDLEVTLWVGSTPAPKAKFLFWPQGMIQGPQSSSPIWTNSRKKHVLRGLYYYRASWSKGTKTRSIEYSNPASVANTERLDLVNGSGFFCCRFNEQSCGEVANEKECSP